MGRRVARIDREALEVCQRMGTSVEACLAPFRRAGYRGWHIDDSAVMHRRAARRSVPTAELLAPIDDRRLASDDWPHLLWAAPGEALPARMRIAYFSVSDQLGGSEIVLLEMIKGVRRLRPDWTLQMILPGRGPLLDQAEAAGADPPLRPPPMFRLLVTWDRS